MEEGGEDRLSKKKITEMDHGTGPKHAQLLFLMEEAKCEEMSSMVLKRELKYEAHTRKSDKRIVVECIREEETERKGEIKNKWKEHRKTAMERYNLEKSDRRRIKK